MSENLENGRARIAWQHERTRPFALVPDAKKKNKADKHHAKTRVSFFRYAYYDVAFEFFVRQVLDAEFVRLPEPTKRTAELGSRYANDYVCAPFKHILGDYIEALELGANVLVQFAGPCRMNYYGELQESILRDLGYEFQMVNFAESGSVPIRDYVAMCKKKVNPNLSVPHGVRNMMALIHMLQLLDQMNDFYLANAGFEVQKGSFDRALAVYYDEMRSATCEADIVQAHQRGMEAVRSIALNKPARPLRVGVVGEFYTAVDPHSNLHLERKLIDMGIEVHRMVNLSNRWIGYSEKNQRAGVSRYVEYEMGPTSTMTVAAAVQYAEQGFDGLVHAKCSCCTPEVDCMPILQRISADYQIPVLFLSYEAQTSDTGLDTRLEAFYDMMAMKKQGRRRS